MGERIGGHTQIVQATPVCNITAPYASGDLIGGKLTLTDAARFGDKLRPGTGIIQSVILTDLAKQSADLDVVFFDSDPSATTFTDQAALDIDDADLVKIIGVASVTSWAAFADNSAGQLLNVGLAFDLGQATSIFAAIVSRGTPSFASESDLRLRTFILQD